MNPETLNQDSNENKVQAKKIKKIKLLLAICL